MKKKLIVPLALVFAMLLCMPAMAATVCKIGSKGYSSLQEAVNNVKEGQTIKVTKAIVTSNPLSFGGTMKKQNGGVSYTIDFKNKKYTYNGWDYAIIFRQPPNGEHTSTVTLKNMNLKCIRGFFVGNTCLVLENCKYSGGSCINNNGTIKIAGGKYTFKGRWDPFIENNGDISITKGTFVNCNFKNMGGSITISGGTFGGQFVNEIMGITSNMIANHSGTVTIKGGTFKETDFTMFWNYEGATFNISGGNFTGVMNKNAMNITGGTFN